MDLIRKSDLESLMGVKKDWCVSLYMPTQMAGRETRQNPILFRNLARKAEEQLRQAGMAHKEIKKFLQPARQLLENNFFWQHQSKGLAVFLSSGALQTYRLPKVLKNWQWWPSAFTSNPFCLYMPVEGISMCSL